MPPTPLGSLLSARLLAERLPPPGGWRPFPPVTDRAQWDAVHPATADALLAVVGSALARPWPLLTASGYLRFSVDGDRVGYEERYLARRARLAAAVLEAGLRGPAAGRIADIADGVWLLCEETSWCLPAHSPTPLPDPARPHIDLFAAETAALLAWTDLLAGDLIGEQVRSRLAGEVRQRVLAPYRARDDWHWFGLPAASQPAADLNNWTPWIHANLLTASLLLDTGRDEIITTAQRTVGALDRYLAGVPADGGCDEGISYWWKAGGCLFECLQTLQSACGTDAGVFGIPLVRAIAAYPMLVHIGGPWQVNFADGPARASGAMPRLLYRYGRQVGDAEVARHARALRGPDPAVLPVEPSPDSSLGRLLGALFDAEWAAEPPQRFPMPGQAWLPDTGVLVARERPGAADGLLLAAKAGHNAEQHNHNDVGSFVIALDGRPLLIDVGVGVYTRQTFGPDRYQIWSMQSSWHNVPEVDGVAQQPGRSFRAREVRATLSEVTAELAMELAAAYPPDAGIATWRRALRLDRGRGAVTVDDTWELTRVPGRVVLHLVTAAEPREAADGHLLVPGEGRDLLIVYPAETLTASVEQRPVNDRRLEASWGQAVWRVALTARPRGRRGSAHLEISAAREVTGR
jgi:Heparinase II/III-like protein